ncbi:MAG: acyltransferase [Parcubacteria group bacterium]
MTDKKYFCHTSSYVDEPCEIGESTKIWHFSHILAGAKIGKNCSLGQNVNVGGKAVIGSNVKIQNNVSVYDGVTLEDYVFCGPSMVFTNDMNPRSKYPKHGVYLPTLVKEGASIGANATIVCGTIIGRHAFIGSGSVVTKNIPDYALAYGNPARVYGWICECGEKIDFGSQSKTTCGACGRNYTISGDRVVEIK